MRTYLINTRKKWEKNYWVLQFIHYVNMVRHSRFMTKEYFPFHTLEHQCGVTICQSSNQQLPNLSSFSHKHTEESVLYIYIYIYKYKYLYIHTYTHTHTHRHTYTHTKPVREVFLHCYGLFLLSSLLPWCSSCD